MAQIRLFGPHHVAESGVCGEPTHVGRPLAGLFPAVLTLRDFTLTATGILLDEGSFERATTRRPAQNTADWIRPDRHWAGLRIRLFGHAGLQGVARGGLRGRPGQFESGHDHDRSQHGRPDVYRAVDVGNRRQDHRARASGRAAADARGADGFEPGHGSCRDMACWTSTASR